VRHKEIKVPPENALLWPEVATGAGQGGLPLEMHKTVRTVGRIQCVLEVMSIPFLVINLLLKKSKLTRSPGYVTIRIRTCTV